MPVAARSQADRQSGRFRHHRRRRRRQGDHRKTANAETIFHTRSPHALIVGRSVAPHVGFGAKILNYALR